MGKIKIKDLAESAGGTPFFIKVDDAFVFFGDSQIASGALSSPKAYSGQGISTHLQIALSSTAINPQNGNKGVVGETTTQMLARIGAAYAGKPKAVLIIAGTNDLASATSAQTIANQNLIISAFKSVNALVIITTIMPRFGGQVLSTANETKRQEVNTYIRTLSSSQVIPIDIENLSLVSSDFYDGLHLTVASAKKVAQYIKTFLSPYFLSSKPTDLLHADNVFTINPFLTGTTGTKTGTAAGTVATGWELSNSSAANVTVVGSKATDNNLNQQVITLGGTAAGDNAVFFRQYYTTGAPAVGDTVEGIVEFEVITALSPEIVGIGAYFDVWDSSFASVFGGSNNAYKCTDGSSFPYTVGERIVMRTPPQKVTSGTPTQVAQGLEIKFKTPISGNAAPTYGAIKIHRIGVRKVY